MSQAYPRASFIVCLYVRAQRGVMFVTPRAGNTAAAEMLNCLRIRRGVIGPDCSVIVAFPGTAIGLKKRISAMPARRNGVTADVENPIKCNAKPYSAIERLRA